ncbi:MAG: hypothetical protein K9K78_07670 [Spirochaetales bacterium]|nr:hypothetical protein [Spirochaetales bacterium]
MKKVYTVILIGIICITGALMTVSAESSTATLHLRAVVEKSASISIDTREASSRAAQRSTADSSENSVFLGVVSETSNTSSGYSVSLESENAAAFASDSGVLTADDSHEALPYDIHYGGETVGMEAGRALISKSSRSTGQALSRELSVTYPNNSDKTGAYSDTLIMTIAVN